MDESRGDFGGVLLKERRLYLWGETRTLPSGGLETPFSITGASTALDLRRPGELANLVIGDPVRLLVRRKAFSKGELSFRFFSSSATSFRFDDSVSD